MIRDLYANSLKCWGSKVTKTVKMPKGHMMTSIVGLLKSNINEKTESYHSSIARCCLKNEKPHFLMFADFDVERQTFFFFHSIRLVLSPERLKRVH